MDKFLKPGVMLLFCGLLLAVPTSSSAVSAVRTGQANGAPAELFQARCARCHKADGSGLPKYRKKGQPDFSSAKWQKSRTDEQIIKAITFGKGESMPAFKTKLSADEIKALTSQIRSLARKP